MSISRSASSRIGPIQSLTSGIDARLLGYREAITSRAARSSRKACMAAMRPARTIQAPRHGNVEIPFPQQ
jgi:hypothetical protein